MRRNELHTTHSPSSNEDLVASNSLSNAQLRSSRSLTLSEAASLSARANLRLRDASSTSRNMYPTSSSSSQMDASLYAGDVMYSLVLVSAFMVVACQELSKKGEIISLVNLLTL